MSKNTYTWERVPVIRYKWERSVVRRVQTPKEKVSFYNLIYQWNRRKTFKTFRLLYKHEFIGFNPIRRVYCIIKQTVNGRYKELEQELAEKIVKER